MEDFFDSINDVLNSMPNILTAIIILIFAFLVAWLVKTLVIKLLKLVKFDKLLKKANMSNEKQNDTFNFIGKFVYLLVFIFFLPAVFEKLGLHDIASPVVNLVDSFVSYLPNLIGAILLLIIGFFVARTVKELLVPLFKKLNVDKYFERVGLESKDNTTISEVLASVVYIFILIPIVIAALNQLNIEAISVPAVNMLNQILAFVPRIAVALVIFLVGKFVADLVFKILEKVLSTTGMDNLSKNLADAAGVRDSKKFTLSMSIAYIVKVVILIIFIVEALNILQLDVLTNIGRTVIEYMPYAVSAVIILGLALIIASFVENKITKRFPNATLTALIVKIIILVVGVFITLYQLGIAQTIINSAFIIVLSALAVAFALSFGLGGREFAKNVLSKFEKKLNK